MSPVPSGVLCTWKRAASLEGTLAALLARREPPPHEILVEVRLWFVAGFIGERRV